MFPVAALMVSFAFSSPAAHAETDRVHWVAMEDPGPDDEFASVGIDVQGDVKLTGWICYSLDQCPAGTIKMDPSGNYVGCSPTCGDSCRVCSGSPSVVSLCKRSANHECTYPSAGGQADCGKVGSGVCTTAATGSGDARGCACVPPFVYGTEACKIKMCQ